MMKCTLDQNNKVEWGSRKGDSLLRGKLAFSQTGWNWASDNNKALELAECGLNNKLLQVFVVGVVAQS